MVKKLDKIKFKKERLIVLVYLEFCSYSFINIIQKHINPFCTLFAQLQHIYPICLIFASLETWVLYSGKEQGVSKAVRDAYSKYGNKEFGTRNVDIHKDNTDRHVKLISITDKEVGFLLLMRRCRYVEMKGM